MLDRFREAVQAAAKTRAAASLTLMSPGKAREEAIKAQAEQEVTAVMKNVSSTVNNQMSSVTWSKEYARPGWIEELWNELSVGAAERGR